MSTSIVINTVHARRAGCWLKHAVIAMFFFLLLGLATALAPAAIAQEATAPPAAATAPAPNPPATSASPDPVGQPASYAALADLLENSETREKLVDELRRLAGQDNASAPDGTVQGGAAGPRARSTSPLSQREQANAATTMPADGIAGRLQIFGNQLRTDLSGSWQVVQSLASGKRVSGVSIDRWMPALNSLVVAIIAVIIAYLILRRIANYGFHRLNAWITPPEPETAADNATGRPIQPEAKPAGRRNSLRHLTSFARGRKLLGVIIALLIDLAASVLAGLAGYAAVIAFTRSGSSVSIFAMQFLTAFVMIEAIKAVSRGVFATRYERLRLLPVSSEAAHYWNRWVVVIISITGYSLLVVVPVAQRLLTPSVGHLLGLVLMLAVYLYAINVVWNKRHTVRQGLIHQAERMTTTVFGTLVRILARVWHWLVITYLTVLFIVSQTDQQQALSFMGKATVQSLIAVVIGAILIAAVSSLASRRLQLPDQWRSALPSLEARVNAYVPPFLKGLRLLIVILVALVVLDAWHAFNLADWLASGSGQAAISVVVHVGIILLIAASSWTVLASVIEHRLGMSGGRRGPTEREKTLLMLFRNAAAVTIATMTILVVLSQIGIDIGPLIAGAGVAGLAIGFGAQKLVQDVITGVFIQLENGMNQNDIVEVADLFGTVEKITIRSVVIRTLDGGYHLIPFSTIDKLTNHTRDYGYHYAEYNIAHRESVQDAIVQLELAFKAMMQDPEVAAEVLEDISIPGVTSLNERGFTIRVMIKTTPGNQWAIQRAFNRLVKEHFDAAGIELPYPQTVLHFGRDKKGEAAPLDVRQVNKLEDAFNVHSAPGQTFRPGLDQQPDSGAAAQA